MKTVIREIEKKILDQEYKSYDIINFKEEIGIPYVLKVYGDICREICFNPKLQGNEFIQSKVINQFTLALNHCIRWLNYNSDKKSSDGMSHLQLDLLARDFLSWGKDYNEIAQQFVAWSRGLINVEVDENKKIIKFYYLGEEELYFSFQQDLSSQEIMRKGIEELPYKIINQYFQNWIRNLDLSTPPIILEWEKARNSNLFDKLYSHFRKITIPEIDQNVDLGGYNLGDFITFYTTLYINFLFISSIEDQIDSETNFVNQFGSNPLDLPASQFIKFISQMTKLNCEKVRSIIDDLTFNCENFHSSVTNQPFVKSKNNSYYILPRLIIQLNPNDILIGALNKSDKTVYDKLIEKIERKNTIIIKKRIDDVWKNNMIIYHDKVFKKKGITIKPDFVIYDNTKNELLIIEYKHFITPYSASETDYRIRETKKGNKQLKKYKDYFLNNGNDEFSCNQNIGLKINLLLLFRNPMPIPIRSNIHENITYTNLATFEKFIEKSVDINALITKLNSRDDLDIKIEDFFFDDISVKVKEWTFVRQIYAAN